MAGTSVIIPAFTRLSPNGCRFLNGAFGVPTAANYLGTASQYLKRLRHGANSNGTAGSSVRRTQGK